MKTSRKDVERDNKKTVCLKSSTIGYSTIYLHPRDIFLYREHYTDGSEGTRLAKCHGRIRPDGRNTGRREWLILAQSADDMMSFTYERWIEPDDVISITPFDRVQAGIAHFFEATESE